MVKKIQINLSNKTFYTLVTIGIFVLAIGLLTASWGTSKKMFHSSDDVKVTIDGVDYSLQEAIGLNKLATSNYMISYVDNAISGLGGGGDTSEKIFGQIHTINDCTGLGGSIAQDGSDKFCKLSTVTSRCPLGWTQYKGWSASEATSGNAYSCNYYGTYPPPYSISPRCSCTIAIAHIVSGYLNSYAWTWQDAYSTSPIAENIYTCTQITQSCPGDGSDCTPWTYSINRKLTHVGCY